MLLGCRIVTRFNSNTPLDVVEELAVSEDGDILSDRIGFSHASQKPSQSDAGRSARGADRDRSGTC